MASVTVLGGAVANNILNYPKRDPRYRERSCIDWDLILQLEPMTMAGTLMGAALNDLLSDLLLVFLLLVLLCFTAYKTLSKAHSMYLKENQTSLESQYGEMSSLVQKNTGQIPYGTSETYVTDDSSEEDGNAGQLERRIEGERVNMWSAVKLTGLFIVVTTMNLLKGGTAEGGGPAGLSECGEECFWLTNVAILFVMLLFSAWVRRDILRRVANGGPIISDIDWNEENTITFPAMAIVAVSCRDTFALYSYSLIWVKSSLTKM